MDLLKMPGERCVHIIDDEAKIWDLLAVRPSLMAVAL